MMVIIVHSGRKHCQEKQQLQQNRKIKLSSGRFCSTTEKENFLQMTMTLTLLFIYSKTLKEKKGKIEYIREKNRLLIGVLDQKLSCFKILFTF